MLVEELMILANEVVGGLLAGRDRPALYRVHERPDPQAVELLLGKLADLEVPTPSVPEHLAPGEAAELAARISSPDRRVHAQAGRGEEAFPTLVLRALKQARYDTRNLGHSGLASRAYATSPRRSAVTRTSSSTGRSWPSSASRSAAPPDELEELAEWTSIREREAAQVEYRADALCLAWFLERRLFDEGWEAAFDGEMIGAIGSGIFVRFDRVFEGYIPARHLVGEYYELNTPGTALVGRRTGKAYRLGDRIRVRVESIEKTGG